MPDISKRASVEAKSLRARAGVAACSLLVTVIAVLGLWPATGADAARTHIVVMEGMTFSPKLVRIRPGERVVFTNRDLVPHTATAKQEAGAFDSGIVKPGESWTFTPTIAAAVHYRCTFHPMMEGAIETEQP